MHLFQASGYQMSNKEFQDIFTHPDMVNEILDHIPLTPDCTILEPTAGSGNMVIPIIQKCNTTGIQVQITANEIQEKHICTMVERLNEMQNTSVERVDHQVNIFDIFF